MTDNDYRLLSEEELAALASGGPDGITDEEPSEEAKALAVKLAGESRWPGEWHTIAWMVASGASQRSIARELDYTEGRISIILSKPEVQAKITEIRNEHYGANLQKRFSNVAPKAMDYMERVISGKEMAKVNERMDASRWLLEKVTGKPKQEGEVDSGHTVLQILQALDSLKSGAGTPAGSSAGPSQRDVLELAAGEATSPQTEADPLDSWVTEHVPELASEKSDE